MKKTQIILFAILFSNLSFAQIMGKQSVAMLEESPAGNKTLSVLRAIGQKDKSDKKFVDAYFTSELIKKIGFENLAKILLEEIPNDNGKLEVYSINRAETFKYEYLLKSENGDWLKMVFTIENNMPYKINGFTIDETGAPTEKFSPIKI